MSDIDVAVLAARVRRLEAERAADEARPAHVLASGRYLDEFVLGDDDVWRIRSRRCEVENL